MSGIRKKALLQNTFYLCSHVECVLYREHILILILILKVIYKIALNRMCSLSRTHSTRVHILLLIYKVALKEMRGGMRGTRKQRHVRAPSALLNSSLGISIKFPHSTTCIGGVCMCVYVCVCVCV
jgi:hypothetical protein